jgi:hypothetical protein
MSKRAASKQSINLDECIELSDTSPSPKKVKREPDCPLLHFAKSIVAPEVAPLTNISDAPPTCQTVVHDMQLSSDTLVDAHSSQTLNIGGDTTAGVFGDQGVGVSTTGSGPEESEGGAAADCASLDGHLAEFEGMLKQTGLDDVLRTCEHGDGFVSDNLEVVERAFLSMGETTGLLSRESHRESCGDKELDEAMTNGGEFGPKSNLRQRFQRRSMSDKEFRKSYQKCRTRAAKANFRKEFAKELHGEAMKSQTYSSGITQDEVEDGEYLCWSNLVAAEGGHNCASNVQAAKLHALKCLRMGPPWTDFNTMTERVEFLRYTKKKRSIFSRCWTLTQSQTLKGGKASKKHPLTSSKHDAAPSDGTPAKTRKVQTRVDSSSPAAASTTKGDVSEKEFQSDDDSAGAGTDDNDNEVSEGEDWDDDSVQSSSGDAKKRKKTSGKSKAKAKAKAGKNNPAVKALAELKALSLKYQTINTSADTIKVCVENRREWAWAKTDPIHLKMIELKKAVPRLCYNNFQYVLIIV